MLGTLAFLLLVATFGVVLLYLRELKGVVAYAKAKGLEIRGIRYNDLLQIYSDVSFLNSLFAGSVLGDVQDTELHKKLTNTRWLLVAQIVLGLMVFAIFAAAGIQSASP